MKKASLNRQGSLKLPTGIRGLDDILRGGLPRERNTLIMGGPGCGKTTLALQTLVNGAHQFHEPGIFVAFEENSRQIIENAASFGWDLPALQKKNLFFLDARMTPEIVKSGDFDFSALLAVLGEKAREMKARRVVLDGIDMLLEPLENSSAERRELFRLYHWLLGSGLTGIITAKDEPEAIHKTAHTVKMQFMSDCVITLDHCLSNRVSLRNLWVMKYRGSAFSENAVPLAIGAHGIEISTSYSLEQQVPVTKKRVSSGVPRLDTMLGNGYFRGSSVLISGAPGTSKSNLAAAFTEASCRRGERAIYVSFDESAEELVRNFSSVGIHLQPYVDSGRLYIHCVLADACSAKEHYVAIQALLETHRPASLVLDPLTALIKSGGEEIAQNIAERLLRLGKSLGVTVVNTTLLSSSEDAESTPMHVSTVADTWIHLSYVIRDGERNRALTIVKSRGTKHSNQVRELILSDKGITLTDAYSSGGEVLMGTLRWQKEQADLLAEESAAAAMEHKRRELELSTKELSSRLDILKGEIEIKQTEMEALLRVEQKRKTQNAVQSEALRRRRSADISKTK